MTDIRELRDAITPQVALAFEARMAGKHTAVKVQMIRQTFLLSPAHYYARLNQILDDPASLQVDAVLVERLRKRREEILVARQAAPIAPSLHSPKPNPRQGVLR